MNIKKEILLNSNIVTPSKYKGPGNITTAFKKLKKLTSGVWDTYNNNDDINKAIGCS